MANLKVETKIKPKATMEISVIVPVEEVSIAYSKVIKKAVESAVIPGFRKGQAPKEIVEEKTDKGEVHGEVINLLLQEQYPIALKETKISPISNPRVEIKEFALDKPFEFTALVAIKPELKVKEYKKDLKKLNEKNKKEHEGHDHEVKLDAGAVIKSILEKTEIEVSEILVDEEVNRMFVRLINQVQSVGMNVEDYLKSQGKTAEDLQKEYFKIAEENIKAEFLMAHLVEQEKIEVTDAEINEMIGAVGDEKTAEQLKTDVQKWYIKSILAKNKLITKLIEEAEGKKEDKK